MRKLKLLSITIFLAFFTLSYANSEDYSSVKPMFCSVNQVNECVAWVGCKQINPYIANIPNFLMVDLASKTISGGTTVDDSRNTPIERIEIIDELITLSGAEPESERHKDKFGWVMTISKITGQMVVSANTETSSFVIFGSCIHKE